MLESDGATLTGLNLSLGTLSPPFAAEQEHYTATVAHAVSRMTVTATLSGSGATLTFLDGADMPLADADATLPNHQVDLAVGETTIKVEVTAGDGTKKTYVIVVTRRALSSANSPGSSRAARTKLSLTIGTGTEAIAGDTLKVYRVRGHEAISTPFRYEIELMYTGVDALGDPLELSFEQVLGKNATLEIEVTDAGAAMSGNEMVRRIHGVVDEFVLEEDGTSAADNHYRVALVPRLAMLARNRQNRIHATSALPRTLEEVIESKLLSSGSDYGPDEGDDRVVLEADEFHIDIDETTNPLTNLSHVAQYDETDLDFIRRLCERHGVYFFFASNAGDSDHAEDTRGMVVFANTNDPFGVIRFEAGAGGGPYKEEHKLDINLTLTGVTGLTGGSTFEEADGGPARLEGALFECRSHYQPLPASVSVIADQRMEFRDDAPGSALTLDLKRTETRDDGIGVYTDYDTHFVDQNVGDAFARIRSQEIRAAREYSIGRTNSPCVAPGRTFTKKKSAEDGKFLVTAVDIEVTHAHADGISDIDGEVIQTGINNRFRCIEFDEDGDFVFRPPRETPVPRVSGVQTAYIGTGDTGAGGRPDPDADGAYRIYSRFVDERARFVEPDNEIDALSKAVRKGEPYAGENVGMHFPLKRDTEVLVAYRNGDPDRPVIAAAMPGSPNHESPVTDANPTSHVITTSSGARFEIHDNDQDPDGENSRSRIALQSREADDKASYVRLGRSTTDGAPETLEDHYEKNVITVEQDEPATEQNEFDGIALYTADHIRDATQKDRLTEAKGSVRVRAGKDIDGRSVQRHLLGGRRMMIVSGGAADEPREGDRVDIGDKEVSIQDDDMLLSSKGNVYIKADGDVTTVSQSVKIEIGGDEIRRTSGETESHHFGNTSRYTRGSSHNFVLGYTEGVVAGPRVWGGCGGGLNIRLGGHLLLCYGVGGLTRHQLRWNIWTVKWSATELLSYRDHFFSEIKSMFDAETSSLIAEASLTECEIATTVTEASSLISRM